MILQNQIQNNNIQGVQEIENIHDNNNIFEKKQRVFKSVRLNENNEFIVQGRYLGKNPGQAALKVI